MTPSRPTGTAMPGDDLAATIHAFVDGELPADEASAFARRLAEEPALADAVAEVRALNDLLHGAFDDVLDEPVPASLRAVLDDGAANEPVAPRASDPVSLQDARAARRAPAWRTREWIGLAAALLLGLQVGRLATTGGGGSAPYAVAASGELRAAAPLAVALESARGGTASGATTVGLSFRTSDGALCRSYEQAGEVRTQGIACKHDGAWDVAWVSRTAAPAKPAGAEASAPGLSDGGGYRTAASAMDPALLARIDAMRAGDTLDAGAEDAARAKGWAPGS